MITVLVLPLILAFAPIAVWALRAGGLWRLWLVRLLALVALLPSATRPSPSHVRGCLRCGIKSGAEDAPIGVFAIAGWQRLAYDESERAPAVGLPLGAQEEGRVYSLAVEPACQVGQSERVSLGFEGSAWARTEDEILDL